MSIFISLILLFLLILQFNLSWSFNNIKIVEQIAWSILSVMIISFGICIPLFQRDGIWLKNSIMINFYDIFDRNTWNKVHNIGRATIITAGIIMLLT